MNLFRRQASLTIPDSAILYDGPSELDGAPIVVIVTGLRKPSHNSKTGPMAQCWILRSDVEPHVAARTGDDESICGDCPHRYSPITGHRTCYVTTHQAPLSVFRAYRRGNYRPMTAPQRAYLRSVSRIRLGAYGDPAAVPLSVWESIVDPSRRAHTGYTHQWRREQSAGLKGYVMASADSELDGETARASGWRTFRVSPGQWGQSVKVAKALDGATEITCPSDSKGTACADCRLCSGTSSVSGPSVSIVINAHGSAKSYLKVLQ